MILFQDAAPQTHAMNAVCAAVGIHKRTMHINESLKGEYKPVSVNMDINSGAASVGSTRFKGIAGDRWTYTASGAVTNIAARVCAIATGGKILVTSQTSEHIKQKFSLGSPREQALKNVSKPIQVREVLIS
jgi:class 3 adenylate cyclase